jgi:hypothetical protein
LIISRFCHPSGVRRFYGDSWLQSCHPSGVLRSESVSGISSCQPFGLLRFKSDSPDSEFLGITICKKIVDRILQIVDY